MWRAAEPRRGCGHGAPPQHARNGPVLAGLVAATHRRGSFERVYDLPERVLPRAILQLPTPSGVDARRALLARSARALGVATADDLRDYYRIPAADARCRSSNWSKRGPLSRSACAVGATSLFAQGCTRRPQARRLGAAVAVRPAHLAPSANRETVRVPLSSRNLHARPQARARLLRAALPAGRRAGRPRGPEGRSPSRRADRPASARRARRAAIRGGTSDRRASPDGVMAWVVEPR